jgi:hypothetical protein
MPPPPLPMPPLPLSPLPLPLPMSSLPLLMPPLPLPMPLLRPFSSPLPLLKMFPLPLPTVTSLPPDPTDLLPTSTLSPALRAGVNANPITPNAHRDWCNLGEAPVRRAPVGAVHVVNRRVLLSGVVRAGAVGTPSSAEPSRRKSSPCFTGKLSPSLSLLLVGVNPCDPNFWYHEEAGSGQFHGQSSSS